MKLPILILSLGPSLLVLGCAHPQYKQTASYEEPAIAPLTPTGRNTEPVYAQPSAEANPSPAIIVEPSTRDMTVGDLALGDSIRRSFEADRGLADPIRQVMISVHGGIVRVMGPVANELDERAILDKLNGIPGIKRINDELRVKPRSY